MADADHGVDANALEQLGRMVGPQKRDRIVRLFLHSAGQRVETAQLGRRACDPAAVAREMHALRSSAELIGATELAQAAFTLEQAVREGRDSPAADWDRLDRAWTRARSYLEERV